MISEEVTGGKLLVGKTSVWVRIQTKNNYVFQASLTFFPNLVTLGISNITADNEFVFFADMDKIKQEDLDKQIHYLNVNYNLSHFLVLETSENKYAIICFERFKLTDFQEVLNNTLCDYTYKFLPTKLDKGWIIRVFPKYDLDGNEIMRRPSFFKFVYFNRPHRKLSRAHIELFDKLFGLRKDVMFMKFVNENQDMMDAFEKVKILKYGTSNKNLLTNLGEDHLVCNRLSIEWVKEVE